MALTGLLSEEIAKKRKAAKENAQAKRTKQETSVDTEQSSPEMAKVAPEKEKLLDSVSNEDLERSLKAFDGEDPNLNKEDKLRKLDLLVKAEHRNDAYKAYLDEENSVDPIITLDDIGAITTNKRQLELKLRRSLKGIIKLWECKPQEPPKPYTVGMLKEVKRDLVKLLYRLRVGKLDDSMILSLATIIYYIQLQDFVKANESYMKLSIGNVAYPIEIKDIKEFVELARRADIKSAVVKVNKKTKANGKSFKQTKFKVRGKRYQYTLVVDDVSKAKKLQQSLPPSLKITSL
ncbi:hypothetical protein CA7LBN_001823 [Candidozyma auris]|uniref:Uncharacterized protein n=1 Tax=Candidozyma auris TaxID=498019 RepID=A0A8F3AH11_CANAR|nr:hypothetical protein CA7LBN_001823 [[Candida] auris]